MIHGKICNQLTSKLSEEAYKNNKHISLTFFWSSFRYMTELFKKTRIQLSFQHKCAGLSMSFYQRIAAYFSGYLVLFLFLDVIHVH